LKDYGLDESISPQEVDVIFAQHSSNQKRLTLSGFFNLLSDVAKRRHPELGLDATVDMLHHNIWKVQTASRTHDDAKAGEASAPFLKAVLAPQVSHFQAIFKSYLKEQSTMSGLTLSSFTKFVRDFDIVPTLVDQRGMREAFKAAALHMKTDKKKTATTTKVKLATKSGDVLSFDQFMDAVGNLAMHHCSEKGLRLDEHVERVRNFVSHMEMSNGRQTRGLSMVKWAQRSVKTGIAKTVCA